MFKTSFFNKRKFSEEKNIVPFGFKCESLTHDVIVNDELGLLSSLSNEKYMALKKWGTKEEFHQLSLIKKLSNIYADVNTRFKLNLLGLDMVKNVSIKGLTRKEFKKYYKGCAIKNYEDYFKISDANALAVQEHLRWNAFYLMNGYSTYQLSRFTFDEKANDVRTKNEAKKKHGCLTTYYDLDLVHNRIKEVLKEHQIDKPIFPDIETYKYDFSLMNSLYDTLTEIANYKIIKKETLKTSTKLD